MREARRILFILNMLFVMALVVSIVLIFMPQPLEGIDRTDEGGSVAGDLLEEINQAILSGRSFKCSEKELNDHLRLVIDAREASGFEIFSEFKNLLVELNDNSIEIIFERKVLGIASTVSAQLSLKVFTEGTSKMTEVKVIGGRFGSLPVTRNFVGLIRRSRERSHWMAGV